ncbi:hypothetical protein BJ085DRAFT_32146 [Dimargaris cristalligena]|uniref:Uncharacterized protein n=1 Tax=Dimargaris cristalligena TaxID=215637 RepID=A0A4P9ZQL5_9FUNG|nr:hypothetical protein BJ085DRAFT_32146 [Dimargaris cristalligena]|eukprot:RKP35703.1 hypothetical protein BJ085DRAFT_32146 [Dimargaris cristalligena]
MVVLTVAAFGVVAHADQPTTTASEDSHVPTLVRRMFNPNDPGVVEHVFQHLANRHRRPQEYYRTPYQQGYYTNPGHPGYNNGLSQQQYNPRLSYPNQQFNAGMPYASGWNDPQAQYARMFNAGGWNIHPGQQAQLMNGGLPNMGGGITQQQAPYYFQGNAVPPHMIPSAMQQANYMAQMNYGLRPGQATTNPLGAIPHQANGIQTNMSANTIQQTNGIQSNIGANAVQQANGIQTNMGANTMQQAQHNARMNDGLHRGKIIVNPLGKHIHPSMESVPMQPSRSTGYSNIQTKKRSRRFSFFS